jgi:hypothetical protein
MHLSNDVVIARFAPMPEAVAALPRPRSWLNHFCMAPFRDVDDRVARNAAGKRAEKAARDAAMNAVGHRR